MHLNSYLDLIRTSLTDNTFVKLSLSNYKGTTAALKNCYVKRVRLKDEDKLSFTYRYQTNDQVKNFGLDEAMNVLEEMMGVEQFRVSNLFTTAGDSVLEFLPTGKTTMRKTKATFADVPSLEHDTKKNRRISADGKNYLHKLKITDEKGEVYKNAQDKFKQINHYIELLSPLLKNLPTQTQLKIADMGAGKGYLTFALYDYIVNELKLQAQITGVEYRKDLVELCNKIAQQSSFNNLQFAQGSIQDYDATGINILIALHACDTATDDAIAKGILAGSDLIVVAPCCHKQIRREIEKHKVHNELDFLTQHGIFMERQAEMVTDGLRSLILEYHGYSTKVFQFVSDAHTPKNVMIVAEKKYKTPQQKELLYTQIKNTKSFFGIQQHHLELVLGM